MAVEIVTDSTSDIPAEVAQELGIVGRLYKSRRGPTIGTYLRPGALGVALIEDEA